jgi:hypothetical protein
MFEQGSLIFEFDLNNTFFNEINVSRNPSTYKTVLPPNFVYDPIG